MCQARSGDLDHRPMGQRNIAIYKTFPHYNGLVLTRMANIRSFKLPLIFFFTNYNILTNFTDNFY